MALSDYDKKYLDRQQQQAVLTYTAQYERAIREGTKKRHRWRMRARRVRQRENTDAA